MTIPQGVKYSTIMLDMTKKDLIFAVYGATGGAGIWLKKILSNMQPNAF